MAKSKSNKLAIVVVLVTLVVVWLVAFGGATFLQSLFISAPAAPAGSFDIEGNTVMVTGGTTTVVTEQHKATVYSSNAGLSGVTSVSLSLSVRNTLQDSTVHGFTMTITAGTYQSAGGGNF